MSLCPQAECPQAPKTEPQAKLNKTHKLNAQDPKHNNQPKKT